MHKWVIAALLLLGAFSYLVPFTIITFPYMLAEPGQLHDFGDVPMWWSLGEWVRTLWVFVRRESVKPSRANRWIAAAIILVGSIVGAWIGLSFIPTIMGDGRASWRASAIYSGLAVIIAHWLGRWYLRKSLNP